MGLQVKFIGWSFLHGSEVRQRAGVEVSVQLRRDLLQASGPRVHVRTSGTQLLSVLMLPRKGALRASCSLGHLFCYTLQQQWHSWKAAG